MKKKINRIFTITALMGILLMPITVFLEGCKSTPQQAAFQTAGITDVAVTSALQGYNIAAKAGKTSVSENQQVAAAFEKYQKAMAIALDAGAAYAAAGTAGTNTTADAALLQEATLNATSSLTDVLNLVSTFTTTNK